MDAKICCFTGHRQLSEADRACIRRRLGAALEALYTEGVRTFRAGGALGFDTLAALAVLALRERRADARLALFLPCRGQERYWPARDAALYREILARADEAAFCGERYFRGCMQARDRRLVDGSATCLCYLTRPAGGSAYTAAYAQKRGLRVVNLAQAPLPRRQGGQALSFSESPPSSWMRK